MTSETLAKFPPLPVTLKNGVRTVIRSLSPDDGEALAAFYAGVPREDLRFYYPHALDREHALQNAARAHSPREVVLVLDSGDGIGGYAWYRWGNDDAEKSGFGICISRPYQELGAGTALMTRLLEISRVVGPPIMCLTVQLANVRAVKLYTHRGFRPIREQMCERDPAVGFPPEPEYYMETRVR
jgi:ribosomal protein S18 acetylase RimI-like enzyme